MTNILVITGSARPNSVNRKLVSLVQANVAARKDATATTADLEMLNLPFMNGAAAPSSPDYKITDAAVKKWQRMVTESDAVLFVVPEYNHSLSAIQKNAIDWLYKEWDEKPAAALAYGFYAGSNALSQLKEINTVVQMKLDDTIAGLQLGEDLELDGTPKDEAALNKKIRILIDELVNKGV